MKIGILYVAYNPSKRLLASINNIKDNDEIGLIVIVDNGGINKDILKGISETKKCSILQMGYNTGIAHAQNEGLKILDKQGFLWALTLDQDTIVGQNLVSKYVKFIEEYSKINEVAAIGTDYYDIGIKKAKYSNKNIIEVNEFISSGMLLNMKLIHKIGVMRDEYFIDRVDNEFCFRARRMGFKIVVLPGIDVEHKLGNITIGKILGKKICLYNQSPVRAYYRTRNLILFTKENPTFDSIKKCFFTIILDIIRLSQENNTIAKYRMLLKGVRDGIRGVSGSYC